MAEIGIKVDTECAPPMEFAQSSTRRAVAAGARRDSKLRERGSCEQAGGSFIGEKLDISPTRQHPTPIFNSPWMDSRRDLG